MTHHELSPSSFPAWAECPCFDGKDGGDDATEGTRQHDQLTGLLSRIDLDGAHENVRWAADTIMAMGCTDVIPEVQLRYLHKSDVIYFGTCDVLCEIDSVCTIIDYKSGDGGGKYLAQLAGYALAWFSTHPDPKHNVLAVVLGGRDHSVTKWTLTRKACEDIVLPILLSRKSPDRTPEVCEWCAWCRNIGTCGATTETVRAVAIREGASLPANLDPVALTCPVERGKLLRAAKLVKRWAEYVEDTENKRAKDDGDVPEGFKIQERKGRKYIADVMSAFARSGLSQEDFVTACSVTSSKLEAVLIAGGMKKAEAKREIEERLGDLIQEGEPTKALVALKGE